MVKNAEAHAWVEVFDGDNYWVRIDPTPGGTQDIINLNQATTEVESFVDSSITAYVDSLRILWYRRVVNFDNQDQIEMVNLFSITMEALMENIRAKLKAISGEFKAMLQDPFNKERMTLFGLTFGFLFLIYLLVRILLSRLRARAYFKFFGTRKRKRVIQLKDRVLAGKLLMKYHLRLESNQPSDDILQSMSDLHIIRFGSVDRWPTVSPVLKRARKLIKTI